MYYTELLRLCGFKDEEIETERARIERAFQILEIGAEDVERAESRVKQEFAIELVGVRKGLGLWLKQLIDLVLAKEEGKKIVYISYPPDPRIVAAVNLASEEVYCQAPEVVLDMTMGQIFDKLNPILESAEEHGLPPGLGMCSLNQARLGGMTKGIVPFPDLTLTSSFFCDQTAKLDDMLHEIYGVPNLFIDGCMDSNWDEFPELTPRRIGYFAGEIRRGMEGFQRFTGVELSEETLRSARVEVAKLWYAAQQVWELMRADPQPISQADLTLFLWMIPSPERRILKQGLDAISSLAIDVKKRVDEGKGVVEKGAPRVGWGSPSMVDPCISHMIEGSGLALVVNQLVWIPPSEFVKGKYTTFEERSAEGQLKRGTYHSTSSWVYKFKEMCQNWKLDGVIQYYPFSCRPFAISPLIVKRAIEDELNIPVLVLEGDIYDTRDYSAEALRTRVETFAEMLRAAKAAQRA